MSQPDATPYYTPGGAGPPGPPGPPGPGAQIIVPDEAALAALAGRPNGTIAFVESHASQWVVDFTSTLAPAAHEVIPNAAGGNWYRTNYSDPRWRVGVNDIYIDPTGGDDQNDGFTAGTALETGRELFRRWGWGSRVEIGPDLATSPDGFLNVHVLDDILAPDSLPMFIMGAQNASMRLIGGVKSIVHTGTLSAVTPMTPAAPAPGGTRLRLTDAAVVTWAPYLGMRGQMVDGPAAGGTFMPERLSVGSPLAVDCTPCQTTNEPGFSTVATTVTPVVGNTYQIQQLIRVNLNSPDMHQNLNEAFGGFNWVMNVIDCEIPITGFAQIFFTPAAADSAQFNFYQCVFRAPVDASHCTYLVFVSCYHTELFGMIGPTSTGAVWSGGGAMRIASTNVNAILHSSIPTFGTFQQNFTADDFCCVVQREATIGNCSFWNNAPSAINPGAHGVLVGASGFAGGRGRCDFMGLVWGNGNAGAGVRIGSSCHGVGLPQNITGAIDFQLSDAVLGQWGDIATGTYQPPGGLALSWAALAAAKGIAGFGGSAHNIDEHAHWDKQGAT